jgi:hypothetical protein
VGDPCIRSPLAHPRADLVQLWPKRSRSHHGGTLLQGEAHLRCRAQAPFWARTGPF